MLVPWFITDWQTRGDPRTLSRFIEEMVSIKIGHGTRQTERERYPAVIEKGGPSIGRIGRKIKIWPRGWLVVFTEGLLRPQRQPCWRACVCITHTWTGCHTRTPVSIPWGADRPYPAWILILHGRIHYRARIKDICILMDRAECIWRFIYAFRRVCATHPCLGGGECEKKYHPCPLDHRGVFVLFISPSERSFFPGYLSNIFNACESKVSKCESSKDYVINRLGLI